MRKIIFFSFILHLLTFSYLFYAVYSSTQALDKITELSSNILTTRQDLLNSIKNNELKISDLELHQPISQIIDSKSEEKIINKKVCSWLNAHNNLPIKHEVLNFIKIWDLHLTDNSEYK